MELIKGNDTHTNNTLYEVSSKMHYYNNETETNIEYFF